MQRACVPDFKSQWDEDLPPCEFACNNNFHSSIGMTPYEALYGKRCSEEDGVWSFHKPSIVSQSSDKVKLIQEWLKIA